jgi:hypothetical protein
LYLPFLVFSFFFVALTRQGEGNRKSSPASTNYAAEYTA